MNIIEVQDKVNDIWIDLSDELYSFILKKVKDEDTAKDIHQDIFLKIQHKINQLKDCSKLTSWVYQITRNTIIDYYRKQRIKSIEIDSIEIPESDTDSFHYSKLTNCINEKIENLSSEYK